MRTPRLVLAGIVWLMFVASGYGQDASATRATIKLLSGEMMTGTVGSVRDGSLSLTTEYGPVRIPVEKLSPETKTKLGIGKEVDAESLRIRIRELEDLVTRLREENATLRRGASPAVKPEVSGGTAGVRSTPSAATTPDGGGYKISSTGKRHNSRCRYFNSAGRAGSANEGVACKVCGG
jgi:hypothetical protein